MKPEKIIIISGHEWRVINNRTTEFIEPWSDVSGPAIVFFSCEKSQVGLLSCKGKADYASALIEKEVRKNGVIEGSIKVFVHAVRHQRESIQAFYTAVNLDSWQELQAWAGKQSDHCMLIPAAAVLCAQYSKSKKNENLNEYLNTPDSSFGADASSLYASTYNAPASRDFANSKYISDQGAKAARRISKSDALAKACQLGNEIMVLAMHNDALYFSKSTLLGDSEEDIVPAAKALLQQLSNADWRLDVQGLDWLTICAQTVENEKALASYVGQALGLKARLSPYQEFSSAESPCLTSLCLVAEELLLQDKSTPLFPKLAWMAESWTVPVTIVAFFATLIAAGLGYFIESEVNAQKLVLATQTKQMGDVQQRIGQINKENTPLLENPQLAFAAKISEAAMYEPTRMLELIKRAAGVNIRIQRIQLFMDEPSSKRAYRVEGVASGATNIEIANFVANLKTAGWQAVSTRSIDSSVGAFAYIFKPVFE